MWDSSVFLDNGLGEGHANYRVGKGKGKVLI